MNIKHPDKKTREFLKAFFEIAFILFLYYSNLLMGEFTHSGKGNTNGLEWAITDVFTMDNFMIALITAVTGHFIFEMLRRKLK